MSIYYLILNKPVEAVRSEQDEANERFTREFTGP